MTLPTDPKSRKEAPIFSGALCYFPDAIRVAVSWLGTVDEKQSLTSTVLQILFDLAKNKGHRLSNLAKLAAASLLLLQSEIDPGQELRANDDFYARMRSISRALFAVAECSQAGNKQHCPGQPLRWDRSKSSDELDALLRHLLDIGALDSDQVPHAAKVAWRSLAELQKELESLPDREDIPSFDTVNPSANPNGNMTYSTERETAR